MNEKFDAFIKKIRASATVAGEYAGKKATEISAKTGDAFNIGKLNLKLFDLNTDMDVIYKEIGKLVYAARSGDDEASAALEGKLEEADEKMKEIAEIKEKIANIGKDKTCEICGAECPEDAAYCSKCGAAF